MPSAAISKCRPTRVVVVETPDGSAFRCDRASAREVPRTLRKYSPIRASTRFRWVSPVALQQVGDTLLHVVGQHVRVAAAFGVQHAPDPQQELLRLLYRTERPHAIGFQPVAGERLQIAHRRDVTQPARRVLDIRLELIDRAVELRVALLHELDQRANRARAILVAEADRAGLELLEQPLVAGNRPGVERRQLKLVLPVSTSSKSPSSRT